MLMPFLNFLDNFLQDAIIFQTKVSIICAQNMPNFGLGCSSPVNNEFRIEHKHGTEGKCRVDTNFICVPIGVIQKKMS